LDAERKYAGYLVYDILTWCNGGLSRTVNNGCGREGGGGEETVGYNSYPLFSFIANVMQKLVRHVSEVWRLARTSIGTPSSAPCRAMRASSNAECMAIP